MLVDSDSEEGSKYRDEPGWKRKPQYDSGMDTEKTEGVKNR